MIVDTERTPALAICCDCEGPAPVNQTGNCEACGSSSVIRPYSLAYRLRHIQPFVPPTPPSRQDRLWRVA